MKALRVSHVLVFVLLALAGAILGLRLMPRVNPFFASRPEISRSQARVLVEECLRRQNFDTRGFYVDELFIYSGSSLHYLMGVFGVEPIIALGRADRLPLSYWQFEYYRNEPKDQQRETYGVRVSPAGRLLGFHHHLPDSAAGDSLNAEAALQLAQQTLRSWPGVAADEFHLEQSTSARKPKRTDHRMVFARRAPELGEAAEVFEVTTAGSRLASAHLYVQDPEDFTKLSGVVGTSNVFINALSVVVFIILLFTVLIAFLRKYHEGEIGVHTGLWLAGILFFALFLAAINIWERMGFGVTLGAISHLYNKFIQLGLSVVFGYNFIALMAFASWAVGEHALRTDKPRLLSGVDSLFNRRLFTKNLGRELPAGFASGLIVFGLIQVVVYLMIHLLGALPRISTGAGGSFDSALPIYTILSGMVMGALFDELVFRLFLITALRRLLKSTVVAVVIAALLYGIFLVFFSDTYSFRVAHHSLLPFVVLGLAQGCIFRRFGLLASMTSMAVYSALSQLGPLLAGTASFFLLNAITGLVIIASLPVIGVIAAWRGEEFEFTPEDEPAHVRRIKERVRLQKELEIARRVQLGLLPKSQPVVSGFDISGACLPALEVGGDYFDFVDLHEGKLGIAVGDVSGKGVPAAIYMTLTKGILQSHAGEEPSPKQVLTKVNQLMYRTIERNWYVSMFYAVLDSRRRLLRFARAGHNPGIVFRSGESEARLLQTAGIGLGLDGGEIFSKTLVEGELLLSPGDILVLYTDGFTEAMDGEWREFGDQRFLEVLQRYKNSTAAELVQHIFAAVREYAGDHPQHDDMTLVVLKAV